MKFLGVCVVLFLSLLLTQILTCYFFKLFFVCHLVKGRFTVTSSLLSVSTEGIEPLSQSCAVVEADKFWRATGQSNLAERNSRRMLHSPCAVMRVRKTNSLLYTEKIIDNDLLLICESGLFRKMTF